MLLRVCIAFILTLASLLSPAALQADTITLKGDKTYSGKFLEYKAGRFYFQPVEGKRLHEMRPRVVSLLIDPPAKATGRRRLKNLPDGMMLEGYREGEFILREGDRVIRVPGLQMSGLKLEVDFRREMQLAAAGGAEADQDETDLEKLVRKGVVTIVHFHMPGVVSSERQGHYVQGLAERNKGKVELVKLVIEDWNDPDAVKYAIKSAPQFWFYNRRAELTSKLSERFTTEDIDSALRKARR